MKRVLISAVCLSVLSGLPGGAGASDPILVVYPVIRVPDSQDSMKLGRIVRIAADRETQRRLFDLPVPLGSLGNIEAAQGSRLVSALALIPELDGMEILAPEQVILAPSRDAGRAEIAAEEAADALKAHIQAEWPGRYRNLEVSFIGNVSRLPIGPRTSYGFDFSAIQQVGPRTPVWVELTEAAQRSRVSLWFKVAGEALVWEASSALEARTVTDEFRFSQRWHSISDLDGGLLAAPAADRRLLVNLSAGDILTDRALEVVPDVEFGSDTQVISRVGTIEIRTVARSLQTAFVGDLIHLESKSSLQRFEARVVDQNLVAIEHGGPTRAAGNTMRLAP